MEQLLQRWHDGEIQPAPVVLRNLPDSATEPMKRVADFFALVYGLRLWAGDEREVLFARGWVAKRTGLTKPTVHRAIKALEHHGVIRQVGTLPARGARRPFTYLPGGGHLRRVK